MNRDSKIYVAGHCGLAGSAILRRLQAGGHRNLIVRSHAKLDLTDQHAVHAFFAAETPEYVFVAAARVGGIQANNTYRAEFIYQNIMIGANVLDAAYRNKVKKLLSLSSNCIYPRNAPQPMQEDHLLTGLLEPTNEPYAIAKIACLKMCDAYNRQYGTNFLNVIPANLYGPGDNYDPHNSHVLPALIRKMHEAKILHKPEVIIWGSGAPRREFLYSDDLADACVFLMERHDASELGEGINIGTGKDWTIREIAEMVQEAVGFSGQLAFDVSKLDGMPRKVMASDRLLALGWKPRTEFHEGVRLAYRDFLDRDNSSCGTHGP